MSIAGRPAAAAPCAVTVPGRHLERDVLDGARRRHARRARRDRGRRPEPVAHRHPRHHPARRRRRQRRTSRPRRRRADRPPARRLRRACAASRSSRRTCPGIIDEIPALAALAAMMPPGTELTVRGAAELRAQGERSHLGAGRRSPRDGRSDVEEFADGFHLRARAAARRDGRRLRRSSAGDGVRHRRDTGRRARRRLRAPPRSTSRTRASSRRSIGSHAVTVDKIFLVGFMAAGKTTVARALAATARLAGRGRRRADRSARAADGRGHLRAAAASRISAPSSGRSCSCCCRCATWSSPPAAAHSWIRTTARRSTSTACRSGSTCRSSEVLGADSRRRAAPAGGRPGADGAAVHDAAARLRPGQLRVDAAGLERRSGSSSASWTASRRWSAARCRSTPTS